MIEIVVAALFPGGIFTMLVVVHLWSGDAERRARALKLIELLFRD